MFAPLQVIKFRKFAFVSDMYRMCVAHQAALVRLIG